VNPNSNQPQVEFDTGTHPQLAGEVSAQRAEHAPDIAVKQRRDYSEWDPRAAPGTYLLLAINIAVFAWMTMHGVSWRDPTPDQLLHYGANSTDLVLNHGEWYRLLTATFVHIGVIHIATNMWCLWNLGLLGEPLLGPYGTVAVYVLTGVAGNLLSVGWDVGYALWSRSQIYPSVGAGASGAVFGIAGILIVLLSNKRLPIPWSELKRLRTSVARFAGINLVIGASTILPMFGNVVRIDNSAHIGGFLCGLALGPGLIPRMTSGRVRYLARQRVVFFAAAFVLSLVGYWVANLR
jgi:rhomboid protease GluP